MSISSIDSEDLTITILSPILVIFAGIAMAAMMGVVMMFATLWMPAAMWASGEVPLWGALLIYAVMVVSVMITNWINDMGHMDRVLGWGLFFWIALFILGSAASTYGWFA